MIKKIAKHGHYGAWGVALGATLGSLFFSEIMKLPPCSLCWYQRILMYPLVFIIALGIIDKDERMPRYALPLSITGTLIAIYHNLLYYNILPESVAPCTAGISCTVRQIEWFGFVTIPFLSLMSFVVITVGLLAYKKYKE
jgi:disulfide bond formation protein DsbB